MLRSKFILLITVMFILTGCFFSSPPPDDKGTAKMVKAINDAKQTIYAQVYEFHSTPITRALMAAADRGVDVELIADKSALNDPNGVVANMAVHGVLVFIDDKAVSAYKNVFIIDKQKVITGLADNCVTTKNKAKVQAALDEWQARKAESRNWGRINAG